MPIKSGKIPSNLIPEGINTAVQLPKGVLDTLNNNANNSISGLSSALGVIGGDASGLPHLDCAISLCGALGMGEGSVLQNVFNALGMAEDIANIGSNFSKLPNSFLSGFIASKNLTNALINPLISQITGPLTNGVVKSLGGSSGVMRISGSLPALDIAFKSKVGSANSGTGGISGSCTFNNPFAEKMQGMLTRIMENVDAALLEVQNFMDETTGHLQSTAKKLEGMINSSILGQVLDQVGSIAGSAQDALGGLIGGIGESAGLGTGGGACANLGITLPNGGGIEVDGGIVNRTNPNLDAPGNDLLQSLSNLGNDLNREVTDAFRRVGHRLPSF